MVEYKKVTSDESYSVSDSQNYFKFIIKKHGAVTDNSSRVIHKVRKLRFRNFRAERDFVKHYQLKNHKQSHKIKKLQYKAIRKC